MVDGSGFSGVSSSDVVDSDGLSRRLVVGVQVPLFEALAEIRLEVERLRMCDGPLLVDEALTQIESAVESAVAVCDGQLLLLDSAALL